MAYRTITAPVRERIYRLVDIIQSFLPLTSYYDHVTTFQTIFDESNVKKYLGKNRRPKRVRLQEGFVKLFRHHQKLPYTVIRKIIPAGIEYRRNERSPITRDEIEELIACLNALEIKMEKEIREITIDESLPEIQPPPPELVKRLENHPLVEEIESEPLQLFKDGHYNDAVRKACERYETKIHNASGSSRFGKNLMSHAFSVSNPAIRLNDLQSENEKNFQEGFMYLSMGMMQAMRNVFSHGSEQHRMAEEAYEMIFFINWMFRKLEEVL